MDTTAFSLDSILNFSMEMTVFLAGLAALIFVHELGHFLFARKYGVIVEKFSIGFGPKIFGYQGPETEYLVAAIPLGGYVKMKGEDPGEELDDTAGSFSAAKVNHRLAIAFGGPLFNILFALLVYVFVYMGGVPALSTTVGATIDGSPAQKAGLQTGDRIVEVDGQPIQFWDQLIDIVHQAPGQSMQFTIEKSNNQLETVALTPEVGETTNLFGEKENVGLIGITPMVRHVAEVEKDSAADLAGILAGDEIVKIDETTIRGWGDIKSSAIDKPGQELNITVLRDKLELLIKLTPETKVVQDEAGKSITIGLLGIGFSGVMIDEQYGVLGSIKRSFQETWKVIHLIALTIHKLIFGSVSAKNIGGPIMIFQVYGKQAEQGFSEIVRLTALLSINLGLINLLPIPILDGGHILFFLIEMAKGRPVSEKSRERAAQVGLFMILSLMFLAFYNDIMRIIS